MSSNHSHYVAPVKAEQVVVDQIHLSDKKSNLWLDAWRDLRRRPMFWIALVFSLVVIVTAIAPNLFTSVGPAGGACDLSKSNAGPEPGHPLGYTFLGCDIWSRIVHGARTSMLVGVLATIISTVICPLCLESRIRPSSPRNPVIAIAAPP